MSAAVGAAGEPEWVAEVIKFWLEETPAPARFKRDDALDATIRRRFMALHDRLRRAPPEPASFTPRLALATLIVLDQFSRNLFRGRAEAFASDVQARAIAEAALAQGHDRAFGKDGRLFFYLPFEHAEDPALQDRSVALIGALGDPALDKYAIAHRDIILRFGRFPHRNAALGRTSTPEELAFLETPGSSF